MPAPSSLTKDKLTITVSERPPNRLVAQWTGRSDARDPGGFLDAYLGQLLTYAEQNGRQLELRFEKLEYFNSATVGVILRLLNSAHQSSAPLELTYDAGLRWQSVSFEALEKAVRAFTGVSRIRIRTVDRVLPTT